MARGQPARRLGPLTETWGSTEREHPRLRPRALRRRAASLRRGGAARRRASAAAIAVPRSCGRRAVRGAPWVPRSEPGRARLACSPARLPRGDLPSPHRARVHRSASRSSGSSGPSRGRRGRRRPASSSESRDRAPGRAAASRSAAARLPAGRRSTRTARVAGVASRPRSAPSGGPRPGTAPTRRRDLRRRRCAPCVPRGRREPSPRSSQRNVPYGSRTTRARGPSNSTTERAVSTTPPPSPATIA